MSERLVEEGRLKKAPKVTRGPWFWTWIDQPRHLDLRRSGADRWEMPGIEESSKSAT